MLQQKLQECSASHGDMLRTSLLALDGSVASQLQKVMSVGGPIA